VYWLAAFISLGYRLSSEKWKVWKTCLYRGDYCQTALRLEVVAIVPVVPVLPKKKIKSASTCAVRETSGNLHIEEGASRPFFGSHYNLVPEGRGWACEPRAYLNKAPMQVL